MALSQPPDPRPVVLLLQQHRDDCEMYAEFLRYRRFRPAIALTIDEALKLAPEADVIVTGIMLPSGGDGREFIEQLRRCPPTQATPIIVLTAMMLPPERQREIEAVCDGFLRKPCLPGVLVREVRRVLAAAKARTAEPRLRKSLPRKIGIASRRTR